MREIKFRGKRVDNGEYIYGYIIKNKDGKSYIKNTDYNVNNGKIDLIPYEVIPETVGQFIGLKDKNGIEIYEDDIVDCCRFDNNEIYRFKVKDIRDIPSEFGGSNTNWKEVIGNIYDNPDLLNN